MLRHTLTGLAALVLLLGAIGCSNDNDSISSTEGASDPNLTEEFGGYVASAESPGFGDPELVATASESDDDYDDPVATWPEVDSMLNSANAGRYHLRLLWGQLEFDSTQTAPTDWSGSLTISRGALLVSRLIRFEDGQDELLSRTQRDLVEWTSQTTVHHDGLAVEIFVPRPLPMYDTTRTEVVDSLGDTTIVEVIDTITPDYDTVSVTFETGPYSRTFTLNELAALDTVVYVDADSNAVLMQAFKIKRNDCPKGYLAGKWGFDEDGNGIFRGTWMDHRGRAAGYVKGHFGVNDDGLRVFYGKWVNRNGQFEGFLRGTWSPRPNIHANANAFRHAGGSFSGKIYASDRTEIGVLRGKYKNHPRFENGFFQARWKTYCPRNLDNDAGNDDDRDDDDMDDDDDDDDGIDDGGGF